jgi:hypothetical protein
MNLSYRQQMVRHISLNANYTLARAMGYGNTGTSFRNYPRDPRNPFSPFEFGPTFNDERHHLTLNAIANLPWGLQFAPILQAGSARPYNAAAPSDTLGFGSGEDNRAVVVPNGSPTTYMTGPAGRTCYFAGQCHLVPFNSLRGSPFFQLDARLSKNFLLAKLSAGYVELIRNVPLLLQLLFWYNAVLKSLPEVQGSIALPGGGFLNNRGLFLPRPEFASGFSAVLAAFLAGVLAVIVLRLWARRRQERTGAEIHRFWPALALLCALPIVAAAVTGAPLTFTPLHMGRFNVRGGIEILPEFAALTLACKVVRSSS